MARVRSPRPLNHSITAHVVSEMISTYAGVKDEQVKPFFSVQTKLEVRNLIDNTFSASVDMQADFNVFDFYNRTGRGWDGGGGGVKIRHRLPLIGGFST